MKEVSGRFLPFTQYIKMISNDEASKRGRYNRCMTHPWIHKTESECVSTSEL
jgi:hypothetical protein